MSRQISPTAIGGFVVGILGLAAAVLVFFGGRHFLSDTQQFELIYRTSIQGLRIGAPVTIKGTKIGEVTDIKVKLQNEESLDIYNSVVISIRPDMLYRFEEGDKQQKRAVLLNELLDKGLAAKLKTQSILTGLLYIDVDFFSAESPPHYEDVETEYPQFPTVAMDMQEFSKSLQEIDLRGMAADMKNILVGLDRMVNSQDTQALTASLRATAQSIARLADTAAEELVLLRKDISPAARQAELLLMEVNAELPAIMKNLDRSIAALEQAMNNVNQTAAGARFILSDDSPMLHSITAAADSLQRAAERMQAASKVIEQQPEAMLKGRQER